MRSIGEEEFNAKLKDIAMRSKKCIEIERDGFGCPRFSLASCISQPCRSNLHRFCASAKTILGYFSSARKRSSPTKGKKKLADLSNTLQS